jgi:hypothetical protein
MNWMPIQLNSTNWHSTECQLNSIEFNPLNDWMDWRQSIQFIGANPFNRIVTQLALNWTFNWRMFNWSSIELNWIQLNFNELNDILPKTALLNDIFNWRQLRYNCIHWMEIDVNWRQLALNWRAKFSIEFNWIQLSANPQTFNWSSVEFNWIENHSIGGQLNSIEWYHSIESCPK